MSVEPSTGQSGLGHHHVDANPVKTMFAEQAACAFQDAFAGLFLVFLAVGNGPYPVVMVQISQTELMAKTE